MNIGYICLTVSDKDGNRDSFRNYPELFEAWVGDIITTASIKVTNLYDTKEVIHCPVAVSAKYENVDNVVSLTFVKEIFDRHFNEETGKFESSFTQEEFGKMSYNLITKEGVCDDNNIFKEIFPNYDKEDDDDDYYSHKDKEEIANTLNLNVSVSTYIKAIANGNDNLEDYFSSISNFGSSYSFRSLSSNVDKLRIIYNAAKLVTTNSVEIEKLVTSGNKEILKRIIASNNPVLKESKKLNGVIDIPKTAITFMKENGLSEAFEDIQIISSTYDGNTINVIIDFIKCFYQADVFLKDWYSIKPAKIINFIKNCRQLLERGYKIVPLLNYVLKQRMYYNVDLGFGFPYDETKLLMDYINLCEQNGFTIEKSPQDLFRTHDITVQNAKAFDSGKDEQFKRSIEKNYELKDFEVGDFVFSTPTSIASLVEEGNSLHHCIASYVDAIIANNSHIYFMRLKSAPEESFVTVELSPTTDDLLEFKENYNKEPKDKEVIKAVKKFAKKMKEKNHPELIVKKESKKTTEEVEEVVEED